MNNPEYIIIHHSATKLGSAEVFRKNHLARGWSDIGYHYVIGNGTYSEDGEIEEGRMNHIPGAHAKPLNNRSIGICLVGDFNKQFPTEKQMKSLVLLCRPLLVEYVIPANNVIGHRDVVATDCPGKNFDLDRLRNALLVDYSYHWAEKEIQNAIDRGLMVGFDDGTWRPDAHVTRAELAVVLARFLGEVK